MTRYAAVVAASGILRQAWLPEIRSRMTPCCRQFVYTVGHRQSAGGIIGQQFVGCSNEILNVLFAELGRRNQTRLGNFNLYYASFLISKL